jgi:hypothetical protein
LKYRKTRTAAKLKKPSLNTVCFHWSTVEQEYCIACSVPVLQSCNFLLLEMLVLVHRTACVKHVVKRNNMSGLLIRSHWCSDSTLGSQPKGCWIDPRTLHQVKNYIYLLTCSPSLTDSKWSNKAKIWVAPTWQTSQKWQVAPSSCKNPNCSSQWQDCRTGAVADHPVLLFGGTSTEADCVQTSIFNYHCCRSTVCQAFLPIENHQLP